MNGLLMKKNKKTITKKPVFLKSGALVLELACLFHQTTVPQAAVPQAEVPQAAVPPASFPQAAVPQSSVPLEAVPPASFPQAAVPQSSVPQAAVSQAAVLVQYLFLLPAPLLALVVVMRKLRI